MKKMLFTFVFLIQIVSLHAQGTFLSNLNEGGTGFLVGWGRQAFETGTNASGYALDFINLPLGPAFSGNISNFTVQIFQDNAGQPGTSLELLNGNDDPRIGGLYAYSSSGLILSPSTIYWVVTHSDVDPSSPLGGYTWQYTLSLGYTSSDGWSIIRSGNSAGSGYLQQFAIDASPIPEPTSLSLGFFILLGSAAYRYFLGNKLTNRQ